MTPRLRRWIRRCAIFVACWVTIVPTIQALWMRHQVVSAVRLAQSVRLEEFKGGQVLSVVELDTRQRVAIKSALPIVPDIGLPGMVTLCFVPHHRVVARDPQGEEFAFTICFGCDEARTSRSGIFATPYLWRSPLRELFTNHKIPVRDLMEYSRSQLPNPTNSAK